MLDGPLPRVSVANDFADAVTSTQRGELFNHGCGIERRSSFAQRVDDDDPVAVADGQRHGIGTASARVAEREICLVVLLRTLKHHRGNARQHSFARDRQQDALRNCCHAGTHGGQNFCVGRGAAFIARLERHFIEQCGDDGVTTRAAKRGRVHFDDDVVVKRNALLRHTLDLPAQHRHRLQQAKTEPHDDARLLSVASDDHDRGELAWA
jgi:hypothetical protein